MNPVLSTKRELFIKRMTENQEQAKWGFEILLKRDDFVYFFDSLKAANLFSPENNSGPVAAKDTRYVQIPYWSALDYLVAVAKKAGAENNIQLAQKVMEIIHSVSNYRDPEGKSRDNYNTYQKFSEILGLIPTAVITKKDLNLIPIWLSSKYDHGMVGHTLDIGVLKHLLESDSSDDWDKACIILNYCTRIHWVEENGRKKPLAAVDDYFLKELIKKHARTFGAKAGKKAAQIFCGRIHEVFCDLPTYLSRPAVDDHPQNHSWDNFVNGIVDGLRDVLLSWIDNRPKEATSFVGECIIDENEMIRRIAIHVLGQRWSVLKKLYGKIISPQLFHPGNIHELYNLLKERFIDFSMSDKAKTLDAIRQLPPSQKHKAPKRFLRQTQRQWLSAIAGKGYEPADNWFEELDTDPSLGKLSENPDFHYYMEMWTGPGPSPYSIQQLYAFAEDGSLIDKLNDFQESDGWHGPSTLSTKALVDTLEEIVKTNPSMFLDLLPAFVGAKRPYQYGIINGFKGLWDRPIDKQQDIDWSIAWKQLIDFFGHLIGDPDFWTEQVVHHQDLTPTRNWIPPIISEFLHAGTRDDNKAYSPELLPSTFDLIKILLNEAKASDDIKEDAMFQTINSSKGKAIDALFSHSLRLCRVGDKLHGNHVKAWETIKPVFDSELAKCVNANYEFSTLAAAYLVNIDYISRNWLEVSFDKIFPKDFKSNFVCAIDGLAYTPATRSIYALLLKHEVLERALPLETIRSQAHEKIIERIALAYIWGDEQMNSPRFSFLFEKGGIEELQNACNFFYSIRRQQLKEEQIERILCFWEKCVAWANTLPEQPETLLSDLSHLTCYITAVEDRENKLLLAVVQYVDVGHNADIFIEELIRLVEKYPDKISIVLGKMLETYQPVYDDEDNLKKLLIKLDQKGRKEDALRYADRLRKLTGFDQLFKQLAEKGT